MTEDVNLRVTPREGSDDRALRRLAAGALHIPEGEIHDILVTRRSIDARQRNVMMNVTVRVATGDDNKVPRPWKAPEYRDVRDARRSLVIVGSGPAGLFAALRALELGIKPIVLERGDDVDTRRLKLAEISRNGTVDPDCNYSFGEGGAGTFSDGKLYTRSKKRGDIGRVLEIFHYHGADSDILVDAHPHIGSELLPGIIRDMRETIVRMGGEVRFRTRVESLVTEEDRITGVRTRQGETVAGDAVILATGHSARDIYTMLHDAGIEIEAKGLAIGVRLEHSQQLIDRLQYHSPKGRGEFLPPAEYKFVTQADGRGVYSFCMCPGGVIVPAATAPGQQVVNGMSSSKRAGRYANSGMVVEVHPGDFPEYSRFGELEMMYLQQDLEQMYYEKSGETLNAPAQRMTDFVKGRPSRDLPGTSYLPGIHPERVDKLLPPFIAGRLQKGFRAFDRQRPGFLTPEGVLIGLESRTSSPVRIPRDAATLEHIRLKGLYPAGEGAGYAGGIVSAAVDGIRAVEAFNNISNK